MKALIFLAIVILSSCSMLHHYPAQMIVVSDNVYIHKEDTLSFVHELRDSTSRYTCSFYIPKGDTVLLKQIRTQDMMEYRICHK
jgi:hypothetical protein